MIAEPTQPQPPVCPLLAMAGTLAGAINEGSRPFITCMEAKCAWWDQQGEKCAILMLEMGMWEHT